MLLVIQNGAQASVSLAEGSSLDLPHPQALQREGNIHAPFCVKVQTPGNRQARPCLPLLPPVTPHAPGRAEAGTRVRQFFTEPRCCLAAEGRWKGGSRSTVAVLTLLTYSQLPNRTKPSCGLPARPTSYVTCPSAALLHLGTVTFSTRYRRHFQHMTPDGSTMRINVISPDLEANTHSFDNTTQV